MMNLAQEKSPAGLWCQGLGLERRCDMAALRPSAQRSWGHRCRQVRGLGNQGPQPGRKCQVQRFRQDASNRHQGEEGEN